MHLVRAVGLHRENPRMHLVRLRELWGPQDPIGQNSAREGKEFASACQDVQDMLREFEQLLSDKLAVSADKDVLKQQMQEFEPIYQEIMGKEHEVIMLINRGKDIISR